MSRRNKHSLANVNQDDLTAVLLQLIEEKAALKRKIKNARTCLTYERTVDTDYRQICVETLEILK